MPIAIDASTPAIVSGTTSVSTAAFTAPADSVLVACAAFGGGNATRSISNSGAALTWTLRVAHEQNADSGAYAAGVRIWTAVTASAVSRTVTITTSATDNQVDLKVFVITGADTDSPAGATGEGHSSNTNYTPNAYISTLNNSRGFAIATDSNGLGAAPTSTDTRYPIVLNDYAGAVLNKAEDTTPVGTTVTFNWNGGATARQWNYAAIEILPAATLQTIVASGIASAEAFGTPRTDLGIGPTGIASGEAFGDHIVSTPQLQTIVCTGIASEESFGTPVMTYVISPTGVPSGETFGSPRLAALVRPTGISSEEMFGLTNVAIEQFIQPSGISSAEAFGVAVLQVGYPQTITVVGIPTGERMTQQPIVRLVHRLTLRPPSIQETPAGRNVLHVRYGIDRGISIIQRQDGSIYQTRYPALTDLEAALKYWMGGYAHALTVEEADQLTDAGYGSYITLEEANA